MSNKSIDMSKIRRLIQLHEQGRSKLFISEYLEISRTTVIKYLNLYKIMGWSADKLLSMSDIELEKLFMEPSPKVISQRLEDLFKFFPYFDKQIKKPGVTKTMLWQEYYDKHPGGFRSTQFNEYYHRWSKKANPLMHINHKAGDKLYVDYAGKPAGEWNHAMVMVFKGTVIHTMNGETVVEYHLWTDDWKKMVANSKFKDYEHFVNPASEGYIVLQDHGDDVWFRNIKIREL